MTDHIEASRKRLTPDQWDDARAMWRSGNYTLSDLSEKFGISATALSRRFLRNGVAKGEDRITADNAAKEEIERVAAQRASEMANSYEDLRDFCFKLNTAIVRRVAREIHEASNNKTDISFLKDAMKTLEIAQGITAKSFAAARAIAGKLISEDDEDALPTLSIETLTESEIEELRRQHAADEAEMYGAGADSDDDLIEGVEGND